MRIACKQCGWVLDFPDEEIRLVQVEPGDEQLFQVKNPKTGKVAQIIFKCKKCGAIRGQIMDPSHTEWSREKVVSIKVFQDPTSNGQINLRIVHAPMNLLDHTDMSEAEQKLLFDILLLCAKKLVAVWKHKRDYGEEEDRLIKQANEAPPRGSGDHVYLEHAQDLFQEFDEFLVQLKSSLDYLVKVPIPILGRNRWNLSTFGDKGDDVIRALENNTPKGKELNAKAVSKLIVKTHQPWLVDVINARDRLNHMKGDPIQVEEFMVYKAQMNGSEIMHCPRWAPDQTVRDFMDVVWNNLMRLFEDFIVTMIFFRFLPDTSLFHGVVEKDSNQSPWKAAPKAVSDQITSSPGWRKIEL